MDHHDLAKEVIWPDGRRTIKTKGLHARVEAALDLVTQGGDEARALLEDVSAKIKAWDEADDDCECYLQPAGSALLCVDEDIDAFLAKQEGGRE